MGRIMESLEKTGAPEPLLCVNVALRILAAVCTDCLDCAESRSCRSSVSMQIGMRKLLDPRIDFFFLKAHSVCLVVKTGQIIICDTQLLTF